MTIKILYFGSLKETLGVVTEQMGWQENLTTDDLLKILRERGPNWAEALAEKHIFRLVINQEMVYEPTIIKEGDEIAILPPVTGG